MKRLGLFFIIIISLFIIYIFSIKSKADTGYDDPAKPHYKYGSITWTTLDDMATHYPTWETIGFTLRPDKCLPEGNPLKDNNNAKIMLQTSWKTSVPVGNTGNVNTTFIIPIDTVSEAVNDAGVTTETLIQSSYKIYLNGIFQINYSSNKHSSKIFTLNNIMYPSDITWSTPDDFRDRFDVPVPYDPEPQPVSIRYMETNSNFKTTLKVIKNTDTIWTKNYESDANYTYDDGCGLGFTRDSYPTKKTAVNCSGYSIPMKKSKIINGVTTEYYLYRVYWTKLKDELKDTATGKLRKAYDSDSVSANPYIDYAQYKLEVDRIRDRNFTVEDGGIEVVAVYKKFTPPPEDEDYTSTISKNFTDPKVTGSIDADDYGNTKYSVKEGIPTTETVYATVKTSNQTLISYKFKKYYGTKYYRQKKLDEQATKDSGFDVYTYEIVERDYTYYTIDKLNIYTLDKSIVNNYCFPGESVTLTAHGNITVASFNYAQYSGESEHIIEPQDEVEEIEKIKVRNDKLVINGVNVLSDEWKKTTASYPELQIFTTLTKVSEEGPSGCFFQSGLQIDAAKENGENDSDGILFYKNSAHIGSESESTLEYEIDNINSVMIHTPTVCDVEITNDKSNNQMISPDQTRASLVLDRNFSINFPTYGTHLEIKGYGTRDYSKYIVSRQISFPFDTYVQGRYYNKDSWITINNTITEFYLPTWVNEGSYTINCRSISINASPNNAFDYTELNANLDYNNYVATDEIDIEVSGRIYGLNIYDISDYPTWASVFRYPNSLKLTGFKYTVGTKDQNGNANNHNSKYTLTPVNGSHPLYNNVGAIKLGYTTRFTLQTIGNMYGENDYIRITPRFYYVDYDGHNKTEVDLYYSETFNNKKESLVKVGSDKDKMNKKIYYLGDQYLSVPGDEFESTAKVKNQSIDLIKSAKKNIWTYSNIMIPDTLRTYIGNKFNANIGIVDGVDYNTVTKSVQNWYCEYYLPSSTHAVTKGFDLLQYVKEHGGINFNEGFWCKKGYIIINFDIETIQNNERHLSYINSNNEANNYCNMWKREGYIYQKVDNKGNVFNFSNGDFIMYYTDKSVANDYQPSGTH